MELNCSLSSFVCLILLFFFKQKTAYEMRISDWSSDVCSSDLKCQFVTWTDGPSWRAWVSDPCFPRLRSGRPLLLLPPTNGPLQCLAQPSASTRSAPLPKASPSSLSSPTRRRCQSTWRRSPQIGRAHV